MRLVTNGFEFASLAGNNIASPGTGLSISTLIPRQSVIGSGGSRHLIVNSTSPLSCLFNPVPFNQTETYFKVSQRIEGVPTLLEYRFFNNETEIFKLRSQGGNPFRLYINGIVYRTGSINLTPYSWQSVEIYSNISVTGTIEIKIDGLTDFTFSGDTAITGSSWNKFDFNIHGRVYFDDLIINNSYSVLKYNNGNGTIPEGTISGGGASGDLIHHIGDGVDGYLILRNSGTTFSDGATLSDSETDFSATAFGDEELENRSYPSNTSYIQLLFPNGNGATSGLQGSDGNSVNNYQLVDDNEITTDGVIGTSAGIYDTYQFANLPADAFQVNFLEACFYSRKDGSGVNNQRSILRFNSTDIPSHKQPTGNSYTWNKFPYQRNVGNDSKWEPTDVNDIELGPGVEE